MAYAAISYIIPQYEDNPNWWLKAYDQGTTTPKVMALDSAGAVTVAKLEINIDGYPESAGGALSIPYIDGDYDLWAFPTAAEADANDTSNALLFANDIDAGAADIDSVTDLIDLERPVVATYAEMNALPAMETGAVVTLTGDGIGDKVPQWAVTDDGGAPPATDVGTIRTWGNAVGNQYLRRLSGEYFYAKWFEMVGDDATDDTAGFLAANAAAAGRPVEFSPGTYLLNTINTIDNQTPALTEDLNIYSINPLTCTIKGAVGNTQNIRIKAVSSIYLSGITFERWQSVVYTPASSTPSGYAVDRVNVDNCVFRDIIQGGLTLAHNGIIQDLQVTNNIFEDFVGTDGAAGAITSGLWIGSEGVGSQDVQKPYIVSNNIFRNITSTQSGVDVHGVIMWGESINISDNTFENIHNVDYTSGSEAIYTKARYTTVADNIIIDAGYNESAINLKGSPRGVGAAISGYGNIIRGNSISWDSADTNDKRGIYVRSDDLLIDGNTIDGADLPIWCGTEAQADLDIVIQNNIIRNIRSFDGITIKNFGDSVIIKNNTIESIDYDGATTVKLIAVEPTSACNNIEISGNTIVVDDGCTATGEIRCIFVSPSAVNVAQTTVTDNIIKFTNTTADPYAMRFGVNTLDNLIVESNQIPTLGALGSLDYRRWLYLDALPPLYKFYNNGMGMDGSNVYFEKNKYFRSFHYDFTLDPNGTVNIGEFPTGAVVTSAFYTVGVTFVTAGASLTMGVATDDFDGILPTTTITGANFTAGAIVQCTPDNTVANYTTTSTAIRNFRFALAGSDITAGSMEINVEYIIV